MFRTAWIGIVFFSSCLQGSWFYLIAPDSSFTCLVTPLTLGSPYCSGTGLLLGILLFQKNRAGILDEVTTWWTFHEEPGSRFCLGSKKFEYSKSDWSGVWKARAADLSDTGPDTGPGPGPDTGTKKPRLKIWNLAAIRAPVLWMTVKRGLKPVARLYFLFCKDLLQSWGSLSLHLFLTL